MAVVWESTQAITQLTAVVDTEQFSTVLDLKLALRTQLTATVNNDGTTDALIFRVYTTVDDSSETWGLWSSWTYFPPDTNDFFRSFYLPSSYRVRFGVEAAGATDTYVVDVEYNRRTS